MATIDELNAENAPSAAPANVLDGVTVARDEAKAARAEARAARAEATAKAREAKAKADAARELAATAPKPKSARDAVRAIDSEILEIAGEIATRIANDYPAELRTEILGLVSNQLHHLASPKIGWVGTLPVPNRREWK